MPLCKDRLLDHLVTGSLAVAVLLTLPFVIPLTALGWFINHSVRWLERISR